METSNKKRQEYVNSLYSKKELKQIKEGVEKLRSQTELWIQDYLLLDEEMRIIKKHFKLTPKQFAEIITLFFHQKAHVFRRGMNGVICFFVHLYIF